MESEKTEKKLDYSSGSQPSFHSRTREPTVLSNSSGLMRVLGCELHKGGHPSCSLHCYTPGPSIVSDTQQMLGKYLCEEES